MALPHGLAPGFYGFQMSLREKFPFHNGRVTLGTVGHVALALGQHGGQWAEPRGCLRAVAQPGRPETPPSLPGPCGGAASRWHPVDPAI